MRHGSRSPVLHFQSFGDFKAFDSSEHCNSAFRIPLSERISYAEEPNLSVGSGVGFLKLNPWADKHEET